MNGKNCIQFIPIEKENEKYIYTPYEMHIYMKEKEEQGKCKENEIYLFYPEFSFDRIGVKSLCNSLYSLGFEVISV